MPRVGVPNNPSGANSWDGFGTEEPYGQATKEASLARAAPMAGAAVASRPIQAPKRAGRRAQRRTAPGPAQQPQPAATAPVMPAPQMSPEAQLAQRWQAIAAIPGASDAVKTYAALAAQRLNAPA